MKTRMVEERIGEYLGPVDWSYNFASHFDRCCISNPAEKQKHIDRAVAWLRILAADKDKYLATTYGGWPRCGWGRVLEVGMYDGWPYWRAVPSVCLSTWLGCEWHDFSFITNLADAATRNIVYATYDEAIVAARTAGGGDE